MSDVFADTYYFVALVNLKGDEARERAIEATAKQTGRLITTDWVLTEPANMMAEPRHRQIFLDSLAALRGDARAAIVPATRLLLDEGVDLYSSRMDKGWSLTDCISFVVMWHEGLTDALTADHHFEQAGFRALLK